MKKSNSILSLGLIAAALFCLSVTGCSLRNSAAKSTPTLTLPPTVSKQAVMDNPRLSPQARQVMAGAAKAQ